MIGSRFSHYEITGHLGSGGMGDVYQATDSTLGRNVAIKVLPDAFARDPERLARLEREARLLASLNHPNIAVIFGFEKSEERNFLVMELVDGETLAERIRRGPIPFDEAFDIARQILEALEGAHDKGVIHRDLKPANIKINADGKVKVLDFGLAKAMEAESPNALASNSPTLSVAATNAGVILGTASYMSPEQAKGRPVDRRTDVFAFGCILYEMISGQRAFDGEDVTDILGAVVRLEPDWTRLPANTSPAIRKLIGLCLEKNARNRRGTAIDVRIDIESALKEAVTPAAFVSAPTRQLRLMQAAAAILLLAGIALSIPYFRSTPVPAVMRFEAPAPPGTTFAGAAPGVTIEVSPDGKHLAFIAGAAGKTQLFIRSFEAVEAQAGPGTENASGPFWSPDSHFVGFVAGGQLKKVDITGGPVQTLCSIPGGTTNGTWSSEGVIVFGSATATATATGLYRVSAEGGTPTKLTSVDSSRGEIAHLAPQFLPDGRHFLYLVRGSKIENSGIYAGSLDSKETTRILYSATKAQFAQPNHLLYVRDGALFHQTFNLSKLQVEGEARRIAENVPSVEGNGRAGFSVAQNGVLVHGTGQTGPAGQGELSWYDRTGKALSRVGVAAYQGIDLSPDGKRLAAHYHDAAADGGDVWITDLERATSTRFTFETAQDSSSPIWSPDGVSIVFSAVRDKKVGLYRKASNGVGSEELLFESETPKVPMSWAPDGKSLVFANYDPKTLSDLWTLPLTGDRKPTVYLQTSQFETHAQISPDGHWIAYETGAIGNREIWVQSYPNPGTKWQVSTNGGAIPRWRADGKELLYAHILGGIWSVVVEHKGEGLTFSAPQLLFNSGWLNLQHLPSNTHYFTFAVSPDGQKFLFPRRPATTESADQPQALTVILNWPSLLKK